jgi:feruloyl esterase
MQRLHGAERGGASIVTTKSCSAIGAVVFLFCLGSSNASGQPVPGSSEARCEALAKEDFSTLLDAPTEIREAKLAKDLRDLLGSSAANSDRLRTSIGRVQSACRVVGMVKPNVGFLLLMPVSNWNGKFLHVGCGGWCGSTNNEAVACALHPAYACVGTDMGHTEPGGKWTLNNLQAQVDYSYRATHVATLAAKGILQRFYASAPRKSYFMGCSSGGYQAMVEAQRFPWDFDGIIAGAPDMDESELSVRGLWVQQNYLGPDGKPVLSQADLQLLHGAVLATCDMDDGVKDGIISAPYKCKFEPAELQCKSGQQTGCLSPRQVQAVKNIYSRPVNSKGQPISTQSVLPGSELEWTEFANTWGETFFSETGILSVPGKEWKYTDFDFNRDYQRSGIGWLFSDTNPDLRKFRDAGGKLLSYQGDTDMVEMPGALFDYYETVERVIGGRKATQDFYRLFSIPGMNHCTGGDGAFAIDYLSYLEAWVEKGQAPDVMIGAHVPGLRGFEGASLKMPLDPSTPVTFSRPVYPYPFYAKYKGTGDPNDAKSFAPAQ